MTLCNNDILTKTRHGQPVQGEAHHIFQVKGDCVYNGDGTVTVTLSIIE